jgi:hypothetical protein
MKPMNLLRLMRELVVAKLRNRLRFDGNAAGVRQIEQAKNVEQRALAASRRPNNCVDTAGLDIQRYAAESVHAFFFFA